MRSQGNNDPAVCLENLFSIYHGECFLVRDKGLPADAVDGVGEDMSQILYDAQAQIERFEHPSRVKANSITLDDDGYLVIDTGIYNG